MEAIVTLPFGFWHSHARLRAGDSAAKEGSSLRRPRSGKRTSRSAKAWASSFDLGRLSAAASVTCLSADLQA